MKTLRNAILVAGLAALLARAASPIQQAPPKTANLRNPMQHSVPAQRAGAKLFERECAACHGSQRQGTSKAPPLNLPAVRGASPGALFWVLRNGSLRRGMPSFAHLPDARRWQIVTFLQGSFSSAQLP